jgi:GTP diphosphokinase / guanosine-3',5'-bis(diphosphate) 3'-diphosphatase
MEYSELREKAQEYLSAEKVALVEKAYLYAEKAHRGELRKSGEAFIDHPLKVAYALAEAQFDVASLEASLLHDVPEDTGVPLSEIEANFGPEVARLVDGVSRLGKLTWTGESPGPRETQAENLRKMLVAMAEDLRVVFIKLADRMHNMSTLAALSPEKQRENAQETLEIYAPLAHRLGIWEIKWQLEDMSFRYLEPEKYRQVAGLLATKRAQRETFVARVKEILSRELEAAGLKAEVSGRPKHIYSIYQKMEKYAAMGKDFDDIHDLLALRVTVNTIPECYAALGIIHNLWRPMPDEFNDYIANPKPNGYQSLHTAVMCFGVPLEVQIRTRQMHYIAEYGVAAHWRYKEGEKKDDHFEEKIGWLRQLVEWHRELSGAEEFLESVKTDIIVDQVFVFTPKGEIKDLPKGATPLDFAYRVHTELGHHCVGAKINGRMVSLNYQLKNGDVIEIISSKKSKGPSRDWLSPHLGFTRTSHARQKIRQWFAKQERTANIDIGRELLEKELRHLGVRLSERDALAKAFKFENIDDFLEAIGDGNIGTAQIAQKLAAPPDEAPKPPDSVTTVAPQPAAANTPISVLGSGNLMTHLAQCCHPVPGDDIIGYITRSRGVTIHCRNCYNVIHEDEKERLIPVDWGKTEAFYPVRVQVEARDRVGLMRDISAMVAEEKVNISSLNLVNRGDRLVTLFFTLETRGLAQLSRLLAKVEGIEGVISAARLEGS